MVSTYNNEAFRGLSWVNSASEKEVTVVGAGGISSWLAFLLANIVKSIIIWDNDKIEVRNLSGQLFSNQQIGQYKVYAVKEILKTFYDLNNRATLVPYPAMKDYFNIGEKYVFLGVDSLNTRRKLVKEAYAAEAKLIIDGRLDAEKFQVYTIAEGVEDKDGNKLTRTQAYNQYMNHHCPNDSDLPIESCTTKQTAFWANGVAWAMMKQFTKFIGIEQGYPMYLPFKIEQDLWS